MADFQYRHVLTFRQRELERIEKASATPSPGEGFLRGVGMIGLAGVGDALVVAFPGWGNAPGTRVAGGGG